MSQRLDSSSDERIKGGKKGQADTQKKWLILYLSSTGQLAILGIFPIVPSWGFFHYVTCRA
jgi:hypothetical protein